MSAGNRSLEEEIEDIDNLPRAPRTPLLALVTIHQVCARGTKAAMNTRIEEDRLDVLARHVRGMEPRDPSTTTPDGWARLGAVRGAILGWRNEILLPPKDAPTAAHGALYLSAGSLAWGTVSVVKAAMSKGVR